MPLWLLGRQQLEACCVLFAKYFSAGWTSETNPRATDRESSAPTTIAPLQQQLVLLGRHPVVEAVMPEGSFIPNDIELSQSGRIIILTGPNMAGKSTVLRQVGLITLMAHMGSYVPAENAKIPLVDRIFTRVGASDNLAQAQSTLC